MRIIASLWRSCSVCLIFSIASSFSFYPTKNLGGFGDGGGIVTNDVELIDRIKMLRNYGAKIKYHHDLMDEIKSFLSQ